MSSAISLIISAPSGSGKTTIIEELLKDKWYQFVVSTTSRPCREGETDGENYYFISKEEFEHKINCQEFIEWALVHNNYYGITKKEIDRIKKTGHISVFDVDIQGYRELKSKLDEAVSVFIIPPSWDILKKRLKDRGTDTSKEINLRLKNAIIELQEFNLYDYLIINDNLDIAIKKIKAIVTTEQVYREKQNFSIKKFLEVRGDYSF